MECEWSWIQRKKLKIFSHLKKLQADIVLLQETHRSATATDQLKTTEFPNVFSACYNSRQRGVAILIHKNVNFTVLNTVIDPEGRFIIIKLSIFDKKLCIVSIYGPNVDDPLFLSRFFLPHYLNTRLCTYYRGRPQLWTK